MLSLRPRHPREARQHVNTRASKTGERAETHTVWGGHSLCASTLSTHIIYSVGHRCPQRAHTHWATAHSQRTRARGRVRARRPRGGDLHFSPPPTPHVSFLTLFRPLSRPSPSSSPFAAVGYIAFASAARATIALATAATAAFASACPASASTCTFFVHFSLIRALFAHFFPPPPPFMSLFCESTFIENKPTAPQPTD